MSAIGNIYTTKIEPQLFSEWALGKIFPEWKFRLSGGRFISRYSLETKQDTSDADKTYILPQGRTKHILVGENTTGNPTYTLRDYYMLTRGYNVSSQADIIKAYRELFDAVGEKLPTAQTEEQLKEYERRQAELKACFMEMKAALKHSPRASAVLQYLKGTDQTKGERGYSQEYIEAAPFGYLDTSMQCFSKVKELLTYTQEGKEFCSYIDRITGEGKGIGHTHTFAIAYLTEGNLFDSEMRDSEIKGIEFRTILTPEEQKAKHVAKYYSAFVSASATQKYALFGLSGLHFLRGEKLTIVEGELDTLRALYAGVPNVAATTQGRLTPEQLLQAHSYGVKQITLLFDTEKLYTQEELKAKGITDPRDKRARSEKAVRNTLRSLLIPKRPEDLRADAEQKEQLKQVEIEPFVLYLPSEDGGKVDIDSYLFGLEGDALKAKGQELAQMIENAEGGYTFLYRGLEEEYKHSSEPQRAKTKLEKEVLSLIAEQRCSSTEGDYILSLFEKAVNLERAEAIKELKALGHQLATLPQEERERLAEEERRQEALKTAQNALGEQISKAGEQFHTDTEKALKTLKQALLEYESTQGEDIGEPERIQTQEERKKEQEGAPLGIYTDLYFYSKQREGGKYYRERLLLPAQALTYICAPSGHGKTRLLENLALQVLRNENEGAVLFFTLEEPRYKIENAFLNLYINRQLSDTENNIRTLKQYKSEADPEKQKALFSHYSYESFLRDEKRFNEEFMDSGRLRIYYESSGSIGKIEKIIHHLKRRLTPQTGAPIKAIFIDYIQRLKAEENFHGDKKQEMNAVTGTLMRLSVELGIPFVLSVQLNRQAVSPLEMSIQHIADAAEIERSGTTIMLLYNSLFPPVGSGEFVRKEQGLEEGEYTLTPEELQKVEKKNSDLYKELKAQVEALKLKVGESENAKKKQTIAAANFSLRTGIELGRGGKLYAVLAKNRDSQADIEAVLTLAGNTGTIKQGLRNIELKEETLRKAGITPTLWEGKKEDEGASEKTNESKAPEGGSQAGAEDSTQGTAKIGRRAGAQVAAREILAGTQWEDSQRGQAQAEEEDSPLGTPPPEGEELPF